MGIELQAILPSWAYLGKRPRAALCIGETRIIYIAMRGKAITKWGDYTLAPGLVREGQIVEPELLASALKDLIQQEALSRHSIISAVNGVRCLPRLFSMPKVERKLLKEALSYEAERQMPLHPDELYLSHKLLGESDGEFRFLSIGTPKALLDAQVRAIKVAGLRSSSIGLKALALTRVVNREEAVIVVADGMPVIMRTLYVDSRNTTFEERARQAATEVARTIAFYNANRPGPGLSSTTPLFVTGALSGDAHLADQLHAALHHPIGEIALSLEAPPRFPLHEYAAAIGLLGKGVISQGTQRTGDRSYDISIVPDGLKALHAGTKTIAFGILGGLLLVSLFPAFQIRQEIRAEASIMASERQVVSSQLEEVRRAQALIRSTQEESDRLAQEAATLLGESATLVESVSLVFDALPAGATLTSVSASQGIINLFGVASGWPAVLGYAKTLEEARRFTEVQVVSLIPTEGTEGASLAQFNLALSY